MKLMMLQQQQKAYKDTEMTVEALDFEMTSNLVVVASLKDGNVHVNVS